LKREKNGEVRGGRNLGARGRKERKRSKNKKTEIDARPLSYCCFPMSNGVYTLDIMHT